MFELTLFPRYFPRPARSVTLPLLSPKRDVMRKGENLNAHDGEQAECVCRLGHVHQTGAKGAGAAVSAADLADPKGVCHVARAGSAAATRAKVCAQVRVGPGVMQGNSEEGMEGTCQLWGRGVFIMILRGVASRPLIHERKAIMTG